MGDLVAVLLILTTGIMATGMAWAILYAATRRGRSSDDHEKETPPPGWPADYQWVICTHCDRGWWKRPEDDHGCPYCTGNARTVYPQPDDIEYKPGSIK